MAWINRYTKGTDEHWCDLLDEDFKLTMTTRRKLLRMGDIKIRNINNKNKRVGITSVLLAFERVARLFPTKPETGDNSRFGKQLLFTSNVKALRPVGINLETKIITNEYLALPAELNPNLNEIYRSGILLSKAELEALVNATLDLNCTLDPNTHPKLKFLTKSILGVRNKEQWTTEIISKHYSSDKF